MTAAEALAEARAAAVWEVYTSSPAAACVVGELLPGFTFSTGAEAEALARLAEQAGVDPVTAHRVAGELIERGAVVVHHLTGADAGRSVWVLPSVPVALEAS
ncbi:hypothetical protein L6R46_06010 [Myxococcota bacterium]|nr:hypothetical protein [Myxococcota bacterium]